MKEGGGGSDLPEGGVDVRSYFARGRNALVVRGDFGDMYAALILHKADHKLSTPPDVGGMLRDVLAAATLHAASRPHAETLAWTLGVTDPRANLFVTVSNPERTMTGTAFTEDLRQLDGGRFHAQVVVPGREPRVSVTGFAGNNLFSAYEKHCADSEGRAVRLFRYAPEDIVLIAAQPDCDTGWLRSLDEDAVRSLDSRAELSLLERRVYRFACGCTHDRMREVLLPAMRASPGELFGNEEAVTMRCPRCGARYVVTKEAMEAAVAGAATPGGG